MSDNQSIKEPAKADAERTHPKAAEPQELQDLKSFLQTHGVPLALGICIVLAIFLVIGYRRTTAEKSKDEASRILFNAKSIQDFTVVVDKHASTPAAPLALLKLAKSHYDSGNYSMALSKYGEFKQKHPEHMMIEAADLGKAHCMEALSQFDQAQAAFSDFVAKHPKHYLMPEALFGQARCLEQLNKLGDAKALYEDFLTAHPESGWVPKTKELLELVSAKISEQGTLPPSTMAATQPETTKAAAVPGTNYSAPNLDLPPIK